jgi:hypothetical protein
MRLAFSHLPLHRLIKAQVLRCSAHVCKTGSDLELVINVIDLNFCRTCRGYAATLPRRCVSTSPHLAQVPILTKAFMLPPAGPRGQGGASSGSSESSAAPAPFRETHNSVKLSVQEGAVWLCSDGPTSFGAPDVLQVRSNRSCPLALCLLRCGRLHGTFSEAGPVPYVSRLGLRCTVRHMKIVYVVLCKCMCSRGLPYNLLTQSTWSAQ